MVRARAPEAQLCLKNKEAARLSEGGWRDGVLWRLSGQCSFRMCWSRRAGAEDHTSGFVVSVAVG